MSIKIIADTNALVGKNTFDALFGNRIELKKILAIPGTELVVPGIVIDELLHQKSVAFKTAKTRITESSYYKNRVPDEVKVTIELDEIDLDSLRSDRTIAFTEIDLANKEDALDKIRELATNYQAPFQVYSTDKKENSDKGFKDAYIALTIDEYMADISEEENVFLLTKDSRLAEYFQDNSRVVRVQNYNEINNQIEAPEEPSKKEIRAIFSGNVKPLPQERLNIQKLLTEFRNSGAFASTHKLVVKLDKLVKSNKFTEADHVDILKSTAENNQISWLLGDDDVRDLIKPIFQEYGSQLNAGHYNTIADGLGLDTRKMKSFDDEYDEDEAEAAAELWIEMQSDIARGK